LPETIRKVSISLLDDTGEIAQMPAPARRLACFLALRIEEATRHPSAGEHNAGIRCQAKAPSTQSFRLTCGLSGIIKNWHNTKWGQRNSEQKS